MPVRPCLAIAVASLLAAPSWSHGETTRQLTHLPPHAANRAAKRDLLSVLPPVHKISSGMSVRLRGIGFETKPYGTAIGGLCRYDELSLLYAPTAAASNPRVQPLRPYGLKAQAWYLADRANVERVADEDSPKVVWRENCRKRSSSSGIWFQADSDETAARGINLLTAAIKAVKEGAVKVEGSCGTGDGPEACGEEVVASRFDKIDEIDRCDADDDHECYKVWVNQGPVITIRGTTKPNSLAPMRVEAVSAAEYVTVD